MNLWRLFSPNPSARVARERLQILLAHERVAGARSDLIAILQTEILAAIARHRGRLPAAVEEVEDAHAAARLPNRRLMKPRFSVRGVRIAIVSPRRRRAASS